MKTKNKLRQQKKKKAQTSSVNADIYLSAMLRFLGITVILSTVGVYSFHKFTGRLPSFNPDNSSLSFIPVNFEQNINLDNDLLKVAKCVCGESRFQSYLGKVAVANVIYNRHINRGKGVLEIIYQTGQFDAIGNAQYKMKPTQDCKKAVKQIFIDNKFILPQSVEYMHNPKLSTDKKWVKFIQRYRYATIDDHVFCHEPKRLK